MNVFERTLSILQNNAEPLWEESNLRQIHTNLPVLIFVSVGQHQGTKIKHSARIKVQNNYSSNYDFDNFTITVNQLKVVGEVKIKSNDVELVKQWIVLNRDALNDLWNDKIDSFDFMKTMESL